MLNFWAMGSGAPITGSPKDAFTPDFSVIPDGTVADAVIKRFVLVEKENKFTNTTDKFYEITYKLANGEFANREVTQKIKPFHGKPEQVDRNLNMMKLVMELCGYRPSHAEAPTDGDLAHMHGKVVGIKIREWSMPKNDGSGVIEGNHVAEVYAKGAVAAETGVKREPVKHVPQRTTDLHVDLENDDLPF